MKRAILYGTFIALLCLLTGVAGAQTRQAGAYSVSGVLIDSLSHESEPYATIRIYLKTSPQEPVKLAVTDLDGKFDVPLTKADDYILYITSVGKRTVQRAFTLSGQNKRADLGTLYTSEDSEMLAGVEVVAQKPLVKAEIDKIAYSIEDDPDAKTNTTLEMLRKVPLVTVDAEDNIQVNGSSNFKVHVNGKPNTLMSNNPKEVLRSLPANSIKSIEVITEPGAKYDAEGIGGILNIITTDAKMQGYNVTLGANAGNRNAGAYAYGTVQVGKFTATGNYSYQTQYAPRGYTSSGREDYTSERYKYLSSDGSSKSDGTFQFGNIEASYEIDTLNLLTFSTNIFGGNFGSDNQSGTEMLDANHALAYRYNTLSENSNSFGNVGVNLDYQHSMKRKGEYLTASYKFNNSPNNSEAETYYEDAEAVPFDLIDQRYDNDAHTTEHTLQLDYVNPLNETHYIDAGAKYIFRKNASDSRYFLEQPDGSFLLSDERSSQFDQGQHIVAAYADYQLKWKKLGLKAGVRYEHTFMNVEYALQPERNFDAGFDNVVPTANLSYMLGTTSSLRANYNMRINRPGIWYLNPFRDESDPTSVSYGNPNLDTEKSHNLGLTYSNFTAKFSVNATLNYMFINNGIERYSFMNNGVMESTYGNVSKTKQTRLSLWANWNPGSTTRISINASGSYADYKSEAIASHNYGWQGNLFGNVQQTLPWKLRLSLYGGGSTPRVSLQGEGSSFHFYGIGLSRSFLKGDRLNISISASNMFKKYMAFSNETVTETFRSWSESRNPNRYVGVSVSWRFGELKTQVKKAARSINNDDVKAGGNNSGGGGGTNAMPNE